MDSSGCSPLAGSCERGNEARVHEGLSDSDTTLAPAPN
jgi:hypothetical protein